MKKVGTPITDDELAELINEIDGSALDSLVPNKPITKEYKPYSLSGLRKEASYNTICHKLRMAYREIEDGDLEAGKLDIRIAMTMAKAMATKLKQYNVRVGKEMFTKRTLEERNANR